jgi:hypothetical protein
MNEVNNSARSFYLSEALTVQSGSLEKGLKEYRVLLSALGEAVECFRNGDFHKFDALVGENACQIRAFRITIIATQKLIDCGDFSRRVSQAKIALDNMASKKFNAFSDQEMSMTEILEANQLNLQLNEEEMFVFLSFVLNAVKETLFEKDGCAYLVPQDKTVSKNLRKWDSTLGYRSADALVAKFRRLLSKESVHWVQQIALAANDAPIVRMVSSEFVIEHKDLFSVPLFWTCQALLGAAKEASVMLVMCANLMTKKDNRYEKISEEKLFFGSSKKEQCYTNITEDEVRRLDQSQPVCVIAGVGLISSKEEIKQWRENISAYSMDTILLAGAADHRQYHKPDLSINFNDCQYEQHQLLSKNGFCAENLKLFFINHIYSTVVLDFVQFHG